LKILQLIQKPQLRGAEIFACQLSSQLVQAGHAVQMVSLFPGNETLPFAGILIQLNRPISKRLLDLDGWKKLAQHIKAFEPDIVQANAGDTLKFAVLSKLIFRWKAPIVFRNANTVSDFINTVPKRIFNKFLVSRVSHVASVSEVCRQDFIKTYSYSEARTTTLTIGLNLDPVDKTLPADVRPLFQAGNVLVHVASFVPEKNHAGLLRIMKKLVERGNEVKLLLIGDGKLRPAAEQQVADMKLSSHVFLLGYRKDVLSLVANAAAFLLPSLTEGLPGVILEAMYCKTAVVAYDVGGISEIVKPGETGWLINKNDEEGFVNAVVEILAGKNVDKITETAYNLVVNEFDNKSIARRFETVYRELAEQE
jgi:glycosyltransferase involved in cell wall biosynthesis